ncbi:MAG: polysaccharide export protein [Flavobacteriales bacterium]|nr:polysaccharide export protein [Flavobacteriales bacterium]
MQRQNTLYLFYFVFLSIFFTSCKLREKLVYFNDSTTIENNSQYFSPILEKDDLVSITVSDLDVESVALFNNSNNSGSQSSSILGNNSYLIDENGEVNLPIIGKIKIAGLKRKDAIILIENELKKYLNNPVVQLSILNFKITVLGEVHLPGTYRISNERITILEAIGLAGDLKITGVRNNVLLIREVDNKKIEIRLDLTSKEIFSSNGYFLKQNDVVYVEPNLASRANSTFAKTNGPIFISFTAVLLSTLILITR